MVLSSYITYRLDNTEIRIEALFKLGVVLRGKVNRYCSREIIEKAVRIGIEEKIDEVLKMSTDQGILKHYFHEKMNLHYISEYLQVYPDMKTAATKSAISFVKANAKPQRRNSNTFELIKNELNLAMWEDTHLDYLNDIYNKLDDKYRPYVNILAHVIEPVPGKGAILRDYIEKGVSLTKLAILIGNYSGHYGTEYIEVRCKVIQDILNISVGYYTLKSISSFNLYKYGSDVFITERYSLGVKLSYYDIAAILKYNAKIEPEQVSKYVKETTHTYKKNKLDTSNNNTIDICQFIDTLDDENRGRLLLHLLLKYSCFTDTNIAKLHRIIETDIDSDKCTKFRWRDKKEPEQPAQLKETIEVVEEKQPVEEEKKKRDENWRIKEKEKYLAQLGEDRQPITEILLRKCNITEDDYVITRIVKFLLEIEYKKSYRHFGFSSYLELVEFCTDYIDKHKLDKYGLSIALGSLHTNWSQLINKELAIDTKRFGDKEEIKIVVVDKAYCVTQAGTTQDSILRYRYLFDVLNISIDLLYNNRKLNETDVIASVLHKLVTINDTILLDIEHPFDFIELLADRSEQYWHLKLVDIELAALKRYMRQSEAYRMGKDRFNEAYYKVYRDDLQQTTLGIKEVGSDIINGYAKYWKVNSSEATKLINYSVYIQSLMGELNINYTDGDRKIIKKLMKLNGYLLDEVILYSFILSIKTGYKQYLSELNDVTGGVRVPKNWRQRYEEVCGVIRLSYKDIPSNLLKTPKENITDTTNILKTIEECKKLNFDELEYKEYLEYKERQRLEKLEAEEKKNKLKENIDKQRESYLNQEVAETMLRVRNTVYGIRGGLKNTVGGDKTLKMAIIILKELGLSDEKTLDICEWIARILVDGVMFDEHKDKIYRYYKENILDIIDTKYVLNRRNVLNLVAYRLGQLKMAVGLNNFKALCYTAILKNLDKLEEQGTSKISQICTKYIQYRPNRTDVNKELFNRFIAYNITRLQIKESNTVSKVRLNSILVDGNYLKDEQLIFRNCSFNMLAIQNLKGTEVQLAGCDIKILLTDNSCNLKIDNKSNIGEKLELK